jgi:hypothetical protein
MLAVVAGRGRRGTGAVAAECSNRLAAATAGRVGRSRAVSSQTQAHC